MASHRNEWFTYENALIRYDLVYEQMIAAGIAVALPPPEQYWINDDGERIDSAESGVGMKIKVEITHPQWLLFGEKVSTDISQKDGTCRRSEIYYRKRNTCKHKK